MQNHFEIRRNFIMRWKDIASENVIESESIIKFAETLYTKGIKSKDALHISCAVVSKCDYFFTTDKKFLNTPVTGVNIISPIDFFTRLEV